MRVRPAGWRSRRNRRSIAINSSSGVPMPTKPDTDMVSPSRMIAIASSTETILFLRLMALERDDFSSNLHPALSFLLKNDFSRNRVPILRAHPLVAPGEPLGDAGAEQR